LAPVTLFTFGEKGEKFAESCPTMFCTDQEGVGLFVLEIEIRLVGGVARLPFSQG